MRRQDSSVLLDEATMKKISGGMRRGKRTTNIFGTDIVVPESHGPGGDAGHNFHRELDKLVRALRSSLDTEKELLNKSRRIKAEMVDNAVRLQAALKLRENDLESIDNLRKEVVKAWQSADLSNQRELAARKLVAELQQGMSSLHTCTNELVADVETKLRKNMHRKSARYGRRGAQRMGTEGPRPGALGATTTSALISPQLGSHNLSSTGGFSGLSTDASELSSGRLSAMMRRKKGNAPLSQIRQPLTSFEQWKAANGIWTPLSMQKSSSNNVLSSTPGDHVSSCGDHTRRPRARTKNGTAKSRLNGVASSGYFKTVSSSSQQDAEAAEAEARRNAQKRAAVAADIQREALLLSVTSSQQMQSEYSVATESPVVKRSAFNAGWGRETKGKTLSFSPSRLDKASTQPPKQASSAAFFPNVTSPYKS